MQIEKQQPELLDLKRVNYTSFSLKQYERFKKKRGTRNLQRGSFLLDCVVKELQVQRRSIYQKDVTEIQRQELDSNFVYQKYYGNSITNYFNSPVEPLKNLLKMRNRTDYKEYLTTRARLLDWMIEVFDAFSDKGTDEYTFFRAVNILDSLINLQKVREENIHVYGVAAINIASKMLDYKPITIDDCYELIVHQEYSRKEILKRVNKALNFLNFDFTKPTWIQYLDKLIFDIFGNFNEQLSVFNIRQMALFALFLMLLDVKFQSYHPKMISAMAVNYAVNSYFETWEKNTIDRIANALHQINILKNKDAIIESICNVTHTPKPFLNENMRVFYGYLGTVAEDPSEHCIEHLFEFFNIDLNEE